MLFSHLHSHSGCVVRILCSPITILFSTVIRTARLIRLAVQGLSSRKVRRVRPLKLFTSESDMQGRSKRMFFSCFHTLQPHIVALHEIVKRWAYFFQTEHIRRAMTIAHSIDKDKVWGGGGGGGNGF